MSPYVFVGLVSKDNKAYNEKKLMTSLVMLSARIFEISEQEVMAKRRVRLFVQARTAIASILRFKYNMSLCNIGRAMAKDHSTIINMIKNHKTDMKYDEIYRNRYQQIKQLHTC